MAKERGTAPESGSAVLSVADGGAENRPAEGHSKAEAKGLVLRKKNRENR